MAALTSRQPFAFKDPRFSYTLRAWEPHIADAVRICVFRQPAETANSILRQATAVPHLSGLSISRRRALDVWRCTYTQILDFHVPRGGEWHFFHYDQFLDGSAYDQIDLALGVASDPSFAESSLRAAPASGQMGRSVDRIYERLCALADHWKPS